MQNLGVIPLPHWRGSRVGNPYIGEHVLSSSVIMVPDIEKLPDNIVLQELAALTWV